MNFLSFLTSLKNPTFLNNYSVIYFKAHKEQPLIFFQTFLTALKTSDVYVETIEEQDFGRIIARFETSFLGISVFYWLRTHVTADVKRKKELLAYLSTYVGPNIVALVIDENDTPVMSSRALVLEIPVAVDLQTYKVLSSLIVPGNVAAAGVLGSALFKQKQKMSIDQACLLMRYSMVLGSSVEPFMRTWLPALVVPEQSLFTLSQLLFAKDIKAFLLYWDSIKKEYPDVFWTVFFSEQLWRATHFVAAAQKKSDTKALSFRLPFSFVKKDWQKTSVAELKRAHQKLYEVDYALKNGQGSFGLDLFCVQFVSGVLS